jgi:hypothetical protein
MPTAATQRRSEAVRESDYPAGTLRDEAKLTLRDRNCPNYDL